MMAVLAHKASVPVSTGMSASAAPGYTPTSTAASHRAPVTTTTVHNHSFASPTESEFSEAFDGPDSVRGWDEKRVSDWLKSINCGQYAEAFKANHVNGSNLIECDQVVLKEMGIKKIGDRVRIFVGIRNLRSKAVPNQKKRNRDSMSVLDSRATLTPSSTSTGSPRSAHHTRDRSYANPATNRRFSRHIDLSTTGDSYSTNGARPASPMADPEARARTAYRVVASPMESARREQTGSYFANPASAKTVSGKRPEGLTRAAHRNLSTDQTVSKLPANMPVVRVIHGGGETKVVDIKDCKTGEGIIRATLKKLGLPESHYNSYCFYTSDEFCVEPDLCRRMSEYELTRLCGDYSRPERGRLIFRKIHLAEPTYEEIEKARSINAEEIYEAHKHAIGSNSTRNMSKALKTLGEPLSSVQYPLSPAKFESPTRKPVDRSKNNATPLTEMNPPHRADSRLAPKPLKQFLGNRPESELISQELTTYFPDHKRDEIERTVTLSQRRSARLSRAISRLSIASNSSYASSLKDAPPLPTISDAWLSGAANAAGPRGPRPLSVSRLPGGAWRDSMLSTSLQPLPEESAEPNRKSYVSFDSASDVAAPSERTSTYYDGEGTSGSNTEVNSVGEQYRAAIAEDGEGPDPELDQFLSGNSWDKLKWMKGSLIGQGSFGSVYLALHAVTGELMAVKQVEMPSKSNSEIDKKKESMVQALQREINLLERLSHPNIVKYLGSNFHEEHFNIFLEYVPGGSVAAMLNSYGQLQEPLIRNFVRQILEGLAYLHAQDIIHRDIKGANVLVDNKGQVKISDFGISKRVEVSAFSNPAKGGHLNRPSLQGSVFWMAPEVVKQTSYTLKADIWSLGCLVVEMFTGEHPFPNCNQMQAIFQIGSGAAKPNTPDSASNEGKDFLDQTFVVDFEKRPSAKELMESAFLKQIA